MLFMPHVFKEILNGTLQKLQNIFLIEVPLQRQKKIQVIFAAYNNQSFSKIR